MKGNVTIGGVPIFASGHTFYSIVVTLLVVHSSVYIIEYYWYFYDMLLYFFEKRYIYMSRLISFLLNLSVIHGVKISANETSCNL